MYVGIKNRQRNLQCGMVHVVSLYFVHGLSDIAIKYASKILNKYLYRK